MQTSEPTSFDSVSGSTAVYGKLERAFFVEF